MKNRIKVLIALVAGIAIGLWVQDWGIGVLAGVVVLVIAHVLASTTS